MLAFAARLTHLDSVSLPSMPSDMSIACRGFMSKGKAFTLSDADLHDMVYFSLFYAPFGVAVNGVNKGVTGMFHADSVKPLFSIG